MGFLAISVICSVLVSVLLKIAKTKDIDLATAIMTNYIVCIVLTLWLLKPSIDTHILAQGLPIFVALGVLLPSIFLVMGKAVQAAGIVKSDTAQRLALIIPIMASFTLFGEDLTSSKLIALVLVFLAMGCLLYKPYRTNQPAQRFATLWLIGVFVGYGVIDVLLKQLSKLGGATAGNLIISFGLACLFMLAYLFIKKIKPRTISLLGGLLLGLLNFTNIYTYINAHKAMSDTPTLVFAGMNMGVIVVGTMTGLWLFREKISIINAFGIVLALVAIARLFLF
ncbi:EamA/RhaT family transporter [Moraxella nasicaprae]|uniref:EamA/RhaT family transporter n=1 Tax=Moraxella nasicaprae TaxID=2904122 RepID=A0ABY6F243_9GAMM|nr:EamA/RhaT family transporter [Moraxella nasicaprae]UXZ04125.1 EamA/RhaT family transporter [Moraxella nasicaprae]